LPSELDESQLNCPFRVCSMITLNLDKGTMLLLAHLLNKLGIYRKYFFHFTLDLELFLDF